MSPGLYCVVGTLDVAGASALPLGLAAAPLGVAAAIGSAPLMTAAGWCVRWAHGSANRPEHRFNSRPRFARYEVGVQTSDATRM
ncbi:hypothetical protein GCM10010384_18620 [Streptomyces djakartensis]|uniref:Uncharacterized protein n=1 Tax=Streptomyces djakartensis TaxID=68193 RepID=A0ABQ2ZDA0_9ACTN|nr:hypothetical protein GCM10010384_18620 [Streptomyces djakartensis]